MTARSTASRFSLAAAALACAFPLAGLAAERTSGASLTVTVLPDRYLAAGVAFPDLDALDRLVAPMNPSLVRLEACGSGAAAALLAAAERFQASRLELDVIDASAPACAASPLRAVQVSQLTGPVPVPAAPRSSERYWQRVTP
jgi:hypothetical protein